jgi:hypothetical protein
VASFQLDDESLVAGTGFAPDFQVMSLTYDAALPTRELSMFLLFPPGKYGARDRD